MSNVVEFKKKTVEPKGSAELFDMQVYMDADGYYEVFMQIDESTDNWEVYMAMEAACAKFASDHGYMVVEYDEEDEDASSTD